MSQQAASTIDAIESTKEQVIISEERDNTKPESFEVSDVITDIITKLEAEVKRSFFFRSYIKISCMAKS